MPMRRMPKKMNPYNVLTVNPCEILARVGFEIALQAIGGSVVSDDEADGHKDDHARVADYLRSDKPTERYETVRWLGRRLMWPHRLPELVTWGGQQTLAKLIARRQSALGRDRIENILSFTAPMTGASGLDPLINLDALDVGFSPNQLGMSVMQRPGVELLAILALESVPIISFGRQRYAISHEMIQWEFRVESRGSKYYKRWSYANGKDMFEESQPSL